MRFVLISDVHLDAPFSWAAPAVARRLRQALRDTLCNAVTLAGDVGADAILCGGDLYEHERVTPDTAAFLRDVLGDAGRPVYLAPGNHDWFGPDSLYARNDWPANVDIFTEDRLRPREVAAGLTLWGAAHRSPANTDGFLDHGFATTGDGVHLALFHGSQRAGLPFAERGKEPHAPFDADQIPSAGLSHAFLGHFHTPRDDEWFTYPGNPSPLTFGEAGERGAVIIDVQPDGSVLTKWEVISAAAAHDVVLDVGECTSLHDVRGAAADKLTGLHGVARLTVTGDISPAIDLHPRRDLALDALGLSDEGLDGLVIRVRNLRPAYDLEAIAQEQTVRGAFVRDVGSSTLDEDERLRVLAVGLRALDGRDDLEVAS